jgi:hypothetical protein
MRVSLVSRSKMPPEVQHALLDLGEVALQVA